MNQIVYNHCGAAEAAPQINSIGEMTLRNVLDYLQDDNNDWIGYVSYKITDKKNIEISCLQEFLANVINLTSGTFEINQNDYSIKDGFALYSM